MRIAGNSSTWSRAFRSKSCSLGRAWQIAILEVSDRAQHLGRFSLEHLPEGARPADSDTPAEII